MAFSLCLTPRGTHIRITNVVFQFCGAGENVAGAGACARATPRASMRAWGGRQAARHVDGALWCTQAAVQYYLGLLLGSGGAGGGLSPERAAAETDSYIRQLFAANSRCIVPPAFPLFPRK